MVKWYEQPSKDTRPRFVDKKYGQFKDTIHLGFEVLQVRIKVLDIG